MEKTYLTVEDEGGELRPLAALWPAGERQKWYQPEIDKYMKKAVQEGLRLVEVQIIKVSN